MSMNKQALDRLIDLAFTEDFCFGDLTTESCVSPATQSSAYVVAKQAMVVSGIDVFSHVFARLDGRVQIALKVAEGEAVSQGTVLCTLAGPAQSILTGERVALNFLMRLSGIATFTRDAVAAMGTEHHTRLVDTRKTMPGWRHLEKAAVRAGGGANHRFGLSDGILIKENHILAAGGIRAAVEKAREHAHHLVKIEVETTNLDEVREAIEVHADAIMLDNMDNDTIAKAMEQVRAVRAKNQRISVEASGNMSKERLAAVAALGVDLISMGALTHSAPCADVSMRFE